MQYAGIRQKDHKTLSLRKSHLIVTLAWVIGIHMIKRAKSQHSDSHGSLEELCLRTPQHAPKGHFSLLRQQMQGSEQSENQIKMRKTMTTLIFASAQMQNSMIFLALYIENLKAKGNKTLQMVMDTQKINAARERIDM
mmetsp:Transcript_7628/g.28599  ORF Transcript_7628/g.28599 Transcript_7628/m.28599 type:complete len:138 (+) Transcript_7628:1408-1821(+)